MKVMSFINEKNSLLPVEVELTLLPGLPGIHFLGLADKNIKESELRIKSAIKHQGFRFPKSQQIIVNLRPHHLKKSSKGLELAVIMAYLWQSQQIPLVLPSKDFFVYGDVTLSGEVFEPEDLPYSDKTAHWTILTGQSHFSEPKLFRRWVISDLKNISNFKDLPGQKQSPQILRPVFSKLQLSQDLARLLEIVSVGQHPLLLAGPAGSGKTTIAKLLYELMSTPQEAEWAELCETQNLFKTTGQLNTGLTFRPLVKPHHTTPVMTMIGGGTVPMAGEISRAHGGLLLLDEFLEFDPRVQEALREPFEESVIRVARQGMVKTFPADAQIVATTNLCPCGDYVPGEKAMISCRFSKSRCQSYSQRLSGPLLDRFQILYFTKKLDKLEVPVEVVYEKIQKTRDFQMRQGLHSIKAKNRDLDELEARLSPFCKKYLSGSEAVSHRRRLATLRVASTIADLEASEVILPHHMGEAEVITLQSFAKMRRWDL